jgi:alcohol dehydrogenase
MARPGGTVVLAGTRGSSETPGFAPDHIVYKELHVVGALGVDVIAYRAAIEVLLSRRWPFEDLPRQCAGFDGAEALLQTMAGEIEGVAPVHAVLVP